QGTESPHWRRIREPESAEGWVRPTSSVLTLPANVRSAGYRREHVRGLHPLLRRSSERPTSVACFPSFVGESRLMSPALGRGSPTDYARAMGNEHRVSGHLGVAADDYDRTIRTFIPNTSGCWAPSSSGSTGTFRLMAWSSISAQGREVSRR